VAVRLKSPRKREKRKEKREKKQKSTPFGGIGVRTDAPIGAGQKAKRHCARSLIKKSYTKRPLSYYY
jgi:hypothetical protein